MQPLWAPHTAWQGLAYWRGEAAVCRALGSPDATAPTIEEVHEISRAKSFDYRVLHGLLSQLVAGSEWGPSPAQAHRQELLDFLRLDEWLVDIGDDLLDYEEDVLK